MKIGILTFHWAVNHGAVLQTYATQHYLTEKYSEAEVTVIDYFPRKYEFSLASVLRPAHFNVILRKILDYKTNKKLEMFKKNQLSLSKRYYTNQELIKNLPDMDYLLCGSDQIWNPAYTQYGEGTATPTYFLNFGTPTCKRISVSASFGCTTYPPECERIAKPYLQKFDAISVREKSGLEILSRMAIQNAIIAADPTSLLDKSEYLILCKNISLKTEYFISLCMLHEKNKKYNRIISAILDRLELSKLKNIRYESLEQWLASIRDSKYVITNSFHCTMMCLKFHKPFAVLLEEGQNAGMNDRFYTLLSFFRLEHRIVQKIGLTDDLFNEIDWSKVDITMINYARTLTDFIRTNIQ